MFFKLLATFLAINSLMVAFLFSNGYIVKLSNESTFTSILGTLLFPKCEKTNIKFSTVKSKTPDIDTIQWFDSSSFIPKILINSFERLAIVSGGPKALQITEWSEFRPTFPWKKNLDRHILFKKTHFYRSPNTTVDCHHKNNCIITREYKAYTWIELAKALCVKYIPETTDIIKPAKGYLAIKTIAKCQILKYEEFIFQLTDNQGNFYVMHATETGTPSLDVALPDGWSLKNVTLTDSLIVQPFGGGNNCYYNVLGDHLGQGYHQYIFADKFYPV